MLPGSVMINNILKNAKYYAMYRRLSRCAGASLSIKKKNKITISLTYAWLKNNNFRGGGGGVRGCPSDEFIRRGEGGGGSSLNFSEGDQTLPTTSLNPRTFHIYIHFL